MDKLDYVLLQRAEALIERGISLEQVAKEVGVCRASLYRYGLRSIRGYGH